MAKEVFATTDKVTVTKTPITSAPAPQMVRIYNKEDGTSQDVFPVDAKEIVSQGGYSYDPVDLAHATESPNVYKPVRPETLSAMLPEARQPLDELTAKSATGAEAPDFESMTKAELEEYADAHGIELTAGMLKADQVKAIRKGGS